jgi:leader peptidase (prepilin peptidase)/N-methyltransferase
VTAVRVILFALFGLAFGSFLTVLVRRTPARVPVVTGRSRCPQCGSTIEARDNVPVISYVLLRGRCRHCGTRISPEYPLTELATSSLFAGTALTYDDVFVAAVVAVFLGLLVALALIDIRHKLIPNAITYPSLVILTVALLLGAALGRDVDLVRAGLGLLSFGAGLLALALIRPGGMGMGDVKLAALIGLVLGSQGLRYVAVAAAGAVLAGGVGGVVALLMGMSRKSAIPFGPYLVAGAITSAFWAEPIARVYLSSPR